MPVKWPVGENSIAFPPRGKPRLAGLLMAFYKVNGRNGPLCAMEAIPQQTMREVMRQHAGYRGRPVYVAYYDGRLYIAPAPDEGSRGKVTVRYTAVVDV